MDIRHSKNSTHQVQKITLDQSCDAFNFLAYLGSLHSQSRAPLHTVLLRNVAYP